MRQKISILFIALSVLFFANTANALVNDPLEWLNRKVDAVNNVIDVALFRPLAEVYENVTPKFMRTGISNFLDNIAYPNVVINQFLQGNFKLAGQDAGRFLLNSSLGLAGLIDIASEAKLYPHKEDYGQTFATWGIGNGPYIVLPILGPSTLRDGIGKAININTNPIKQIQDRGVRDAIIGIAFIDGRYRLFKAEALVSGDKYIFIRDAYLQRREHLINNGKVEESDPFLDEE